MDNFISLQNKSIICIAKRNSGKSELYIRRQDPGLHVRRCHDQGIDCRAIDKSF